MLPGPAVPGSSLVSFHFLWAIHPIRPVKVFFCTHIVNGVVDLKVARREGLRDSLERRLGSASDVMGIGLTLVGAVEGLGNLRGGRDSLLHAKPIFRPKAIYSAFQLNEVKSCVNVFLAQ